MSVSAEFARATQAAAWLKLRWPTVGVRELLIFMLVVQVTANAKLFTVGLGPSGFAAVCAGLALVIYGGALHGKRVAARSALGWITAPGRYWLGAAAAGCSLGPLVTTATIAFGHSIHVTEPFHSRVLAVTLGPIVEEMCLRGVMVPLLARLIGSAGAILVTSAVFAFLHWPASLLKLGSIGATGASYGWIRVRSGSTALAAVAHTIYNLTVLTFGSS